MLKTKRCNAGALFAAGVALLFLCHRQYDWVVRGSMEVVGYSAVRGRTPLNPRGNCASGVFQNVIGYYARVLKTSCIRKSCRSMLAAKTQQRATDANRRCISVQNVSRT